MDPLAVTKASSTFSGFSDSKNITNGQISVPQHEKKKASSHKEKDQSSSDKQSTTDPKSSKAPRIPLGANQKLYRTPVLVLPSKEDAHPLLVLETRKTTSFQAVFPRNQKVY